MGIGTAILSVLYVLMCVFLIFIILLQRGDSGGLGGLGGGMGGGDSFLGASADRTMKKLTLYVSIIFIFFSIFLGIIESPKGTQVDTDTPDASQDADAIKLNPDGDEAE